MASGAVRARAPSAALVRRRVDEPARTRRAVPCRIEGFVAADVQGRRVAPRTAAATPIAASARLMFDVPPRPRRAVYSSHAPVALAARGRARLPRGDAVAAAATRRQDLNGGRV